MQADLLRSFLLLPANQVLLAFLYHPIELLYFLQMPPLEPINLSRSYHLYCSFV